MQTTRILLPVAGPDPASSPATVPTSAIFEVPRSLNNTDAPPRALALCATKGSSSLTVELWAYIDRETEPFGSGANFNPASDQWVLLGSAISGITDAAVVFTSFIPPPGRIYARCTAGHGASSGLLVGFV